MYVESEKHTEMVETLINAGADVNAKNNDNWTALIVAALVDNANVIHTLVKYGANISDGQIWQDRTYIRYRNIRRSR